MGEYKVGAVVVIHTGGFMKYEVIQVQETGEEVVVYSGGIESCREWSDANSDQYPESEFYVLQCECEAHAVLWTPELVEA